MTPAPGPLAPLAGAAVRPPPSPLHVARLRAAGADFLRLRPWVVAPAAAVMATVLALTEMPAPQRLGLWAGMALMVGLFALEAWWLRGREVGETFLFRSLALTALGLGLACAASGALHSPLLPLLFAPTVTAFAAFGRRQESAAACGLLLAVLAGLAALPPGVPFPPLPQPQQRLLLLLFMGVAALLLSLGVTRLSEALRQASVQLERAHEDVLAAAEARALSLEAIGAQVAHEVKNPLAAVKGLVELMASEPRGPQEARRFAVVVQEVERIEALVRDSLAFSRPLDVLRPVPLALGPLLTDMASVLEARATRAGVSLVVAGGEVEVRADPRRLREALLNLLGNALEATPPGGAVHLRWSATPEGARIEVRDTGSGMDAGTLRRLGTPFFTTRAEGTGLGVALARAVAAQHGGSLRFESGPGRGTTAILVLPASPPGAARAEGPPCR